MIEKTETENIKKTATLLRIAAYLLAVTLVFSVISYLCAPALRAAPSAEPGIADLTGFDFDKEIAAVQNISFAMYPGVFYMPDDFASGEGGEGVRYGSPGMTLGDYGTLRLELRLPSDRVYALAGKSASYAQRLFIDGKECDPVGVTGTNAVTVVPQSVRYIEGFRPEKDTTEIIVHYSAFVHADGGGLYPLDIGSIQNMSRAENLKIFRTVAAAMALITAMLFFFGLYLFFPKSLYLMWFSLACGCIALRGLLTGDKVIMLLLPDLNWYLSIRLEFIMTTGAALFSALYLSGLFSGAVKKWATRGFAVFCVSNLLFICLVPPIVFTRFAFFFTASYAAFGVYLLAAVVIAELRKKIISPLSVTEQILLSAGFGVLVLLSGLGVYAHPISRVLLGLDYPQVGMMVFLFINILTLSLGFSRTERMLSEARMSEREMEETNRALERLDRLRLDFLANISHEIKTPLTVADGFAQYTLSQIEKGTVGEDTKENLRLISKEAGRLSELADGLLRVSADMAWDRHVLPIRTVIERAEATCRPILAKNNNRLDIRIGDDLPSVRFNGDMIHQVILNLAVNANNHTKNGTVGIEAEISGGHVAVAVSDNGGGISPDLLPEVFKRHVSGSGDTGLGLSICKEIIELHGGSIAVESTPGEGTRVTFTLPVEGGCADESNDIVG